MRRDHAEHWDDEGGARTRGIYANARCKAITSKSVGGLAQAMSERDENIHMDRRHELCKKHMLEIVDAAANEFETWPDWMREE